MAEHIAIPTSAQGRSWLRHQHPHYAAQIHRWKFARDHYTGAVLDTKRVQHYLVRRAQGETEDSFLERCKLADYTNHFAEVAESLVGMLTAVEGDANRVFADDAGRGLGDVKDEKTPMYRLWRRATDKGASYLTACKQLAMELAITHEAWVMVDVRNGQPFLRVLPAETVTNWLDDYSEVLVAEEVDVRSSLDAEPSTQCQYVKMTVAGWERWREDAAGNPVRVGGPNGAGLWHYETRDGTPALPIFRVELPMTRPVGYLLAKKANAIFNKESERDHLLRVANFPRLVLSAGNDLYDALVDALVAGGTVLQEDPTNPGGGHRFITPPTEAATAASEVLKQKVSEFHSTAHKAYDDGAGSQRTATEVRQDVASGTGAYLQLLKAALDDAENSWLWRLEQAQFPADKRQWFIAHAERSDDFLPADPDAVTEKSAAMAFGKDIAIPFGKAGLIEVAKQVAEHRGITVDEAQLTAAVEVRGILDAMQTAAAANVTLPAMIRVELALRLLAANGLVSDSDTVTLEDGSEAPTLAVLRAQMMADAEAADTQKRLDAQGFNGGGGGTGPGTNTDAGGQQTPPALAA